MADSRNETWRYTGRRLVKGNVLADAWVDPSGEVLLYKARSGDRYVIGGSYSVPRASSSSRAAPASGVLWA